MSWVILALAILCEVGATLSLRMASTPREGVEGSRLWYLAVGTGYAASFVLFSLVLRMGIGLAISYGIWTAAGVALTAIAGRLFFKEPFTRVMVVGTGLIMLGVVLIELGQAA